jgi:hypothetical protein
MNVFLKGDAQFHDNPLDIVRRLCSESFGAEVPNTNFCVARHFCRMPYKSFGREYSKSLMLGSLSAAIHGSPARRRGRARMLQGGAYALC